MQPEGERDMVNAADRAAKAREKAQAMLMAASVIIWAAVTFGLAVPIYLATGFRPVTLIVGFAALGVAALPWLAYRRLVEAALRRADEEEKRRPA